MAELDLSGARLFFWQSVVMWRVMHPPVTAPAVARQQPAYSRSSGTQAIE